MTWTPLIRDFVTGHLNDDTAKLLLAAHRYPEIDVPFVVEQIEARKRLRNKLPEWYAQPDLIMSGRIPAEQCSSEQTARFKRTIMGDDCRSLCDMTGGMGVDFWYMSRGLNRAIYTERQKTLCEAARHNFAVLQTETGPKIEIREGLSTEMEIPDVDVIYLDPARRSSEGGRIYEIEDCEPNVIEWQDQLLAHCKRLIVKVSPMADITRTIARMRNVSDIYIVSVKNECKELLIVQKREKNADPVRVHCVDFFPQRTITFEYLLAPELVTSSASYDDRITNVSEIKYFYEPDVSVMKAQAFAPLVKQFEVSLLDRDSHYFSSESLIDDFPGRIFSVDEIIEFSSRMIKGLKKAISQANIATRNFPLTPEELKKRTGIRDGGEVYLFGTTHKEAGPLLIRCHKILSK